MKISPMMLSIANTIASLVMVVLLSWLVGVKAYGKIYLANPMFVVLVLGLMLGCVEVRR
jgi:hypothetical protein